MSVGASVLTRGTSAIARDAANNYAESGFSRAVVGTMEWWTSSVVWRFRCFMGGSSCIHLL